MAILSFDGMVGIAIKIVTEKYPEAKLYEAQGTASSGSAKDANGIDRIKAVFQNTDNSTVTIKSTVWGEYADPILIDEPWLQDQIIGWPIPMDLPKAVELLRGAGYTDPFYNVTLRKPLYPGVTSASFIFCIGPGQFVFINVDDGSVTPHG